MPCAPLFVCQNVMSQETQTKKLWVWNNVPLLRFQPFCWICILTTCLSNWKSGVRAQSLDLWYGNYIPFMPQTLRETGEPEAAAAVFENGNRGWEGKVYGGCNGLHMSPSLLELVRRDRLPIYICGHLLSLITRAGKLSHVRGFRLHWQYGHSGEGGWHGVTSFMWFFLPVGK